MKGENEGQCEISVVTYKEFMVDPRLQIVSSLRSSTFTCWPSR